MAELNWEQTVLWLRHQPDQQELVKNCYYDDPLIEAARRYADSEEWQAVRSLLPARHGRALDIGAGRGISSFALARDGWQVTALEPDSSDIVGCGALRMLAQASRYPIDIIQEMGENLPCGADTFDLVFCREVLHHAQDIRKLCQQIYRVLKRGGRLVAIREHVISQPQDLTVFLTQHALHRFYGGENAYMLEEYLDVMQAAGLKVTRVIAPLQSEVNFFPFTNARRLETLRAPLQRRLGKRLAVWLTAENTPWGNFLLNRLALYFSARDHTPGRLYSFVAEKK
ncbi:MAG: class I SAM-dependent methyltransferase [Anaerolineae bacterium]|nr:class I SAM-dependent methyltransferase [Anaerolineae bacterium]